MEYRLLISPDTRTGTGERCYTSYVPVLGIAADGDTVEEALENAKKLIAFHLESLRKEKSAIPVEEPGEEFIAMAKVAV